MKRPRFGPRSRRALLISIPILAFLTWYARGAIGYVASLRSFAIPGGSMAPTLLVGDRIAVEMGRAGPKRGEVWLFTNPNGQTLVKRVVGLPGETIEVAGGRVLIDGMPLSEPYLTGPMNYAMPPVRLEPDDYFLLGDNRNTSADSHIWGPLPGDRFLGRAVHRIWPRGRMGPIR